MPTATGFSSSTVDGRSPDGRRHARDGRGGARPLVLCAESVDLPGGAGVQSLRIDPAQPLRAAGDGAVAAGTLVAPAEDADQPYRHPGGYAQDGRDIELPLIPYHRWANRGPSAMRVWIPTR